MELTIDPNRRYTYADYLTWLDDKRRELWEGIVKLMSPAPSKTHQIVSGRIYGEFYIYLKQTEHQCQVFHAPFDVRFPKEGSTDPKDIDTVVQPDIVVVCDPKKLDERGCIGAPDLIIEIVSPTNPERDIKHKHRLYEKFGVPEYWIVFPFEKAISVFILQDGKYQLDGIYTIGDKIPLRVFGGEFELDLNEVFKDL